MNKSMIKSFAIWARNKLIEDITHRARLIGLSDKGIATALSSSVTDGEFYDIQTDKPYAIYGDDISKRKALVDYIREKEVELGYEKSFNAVIEEVAYTWFNRIIAIRFMEINDYLPSRIRVLSSGDKRKREPDIITYLKADISSTPLEFSSEEIAKINALIGNNNDDELFTKIFIKQCNALNEILPELFEETNAYSEILLNLSYTNADSIISRLISDIEEDDFKEAVEIIGWMYQYYNTEPKDEVFKALKKNTKISKEDIPAATQLFTPDWIVRYMVENSLGKTYINSLLDSELNNSEKSIKETEIAEKFNWKYYLEEAVQDEDVALELREKVKNKSLKLEEIKIFDPSIGSGHIAVYAFDVLMQIYEDNGYTARDSVESIVRNNLYGLDIDKRAYQLAYFAIMMKARQYDRRFLSRGIKPNIYAIVESNYIPVKSLDYFGKSLSDDLRQRAIEDIEYMISSFYNACDYGSLIDVKTCDWDLLENFIFDFDIEQHEQYSLENIAIADISRKLHTILKIGLILSQKYDIVITNPPYMGASGMNVRLGDYVKKNYPDSKSDLFAVFIEKCLSFAKADGLTAMITQHAFMFLSSFENLRKKLLEYDFINMAHLGPRAFEEIGGEVVQTTAFVIRKTNIENYKATYSRLVDYKSQDSKEVAFLEKNNVYHAYKENFDKIPGSPIAYWASAQIFEIFNNSLRISDFAKACKGLDTGNNDYFIRLWFEINYCKYNKKWFIFNKGGGFRKWYGNLEFYIEWENDGINVTNYHKSNIRNKNFYFKPGYTWTLLSSDSKFGLRKLPDGAVFDANGMMLFLFDDDNNNYIMGLLNSIVGNYILKILSSTMAFVIGDINRIPIVIFSKNDILIDTLVEQNITISKLDWDSFETSWDFVTSPLLQNIDKNNITRIEDAFNLWSLECDRRFNTLKANEEELNRIFIDIYGLQDELTPDVFDKDITLKTNTAYRYKQSKKKSDTEESEDFNEEDEIVEELEIRNAKFLKDTVVEFISFAVGCMFGRYSLDEEGLVFAGGDYDAARYKTYIPVEKNIILISDDEYFDDDIVARFVNFVATVFGYDNLEENLKFIANALGGKEGARDSIRSYFLKDFYKDHVKTYQKRPIYWLYDSGRQDGFKALIYMHRYGENLSGMVRVEYLHRVQRLYESEMERLQEIASSSSNPKEKAQSEKRREKLLKQYQETKSYDESIAHIANDRISIDLDDGVKVNYQKVQIAKDGKKYDILAKI